MVNLEKGNQLKTDKKGKGKEKAVKSANLITQIDDILLIDRMEEINSYNERVFITPESKKLIMLYRWMLTMKSFH